MLTIYRYIYTYILYSREALAPSIVLHLSREFLFIYEFLLLLTMQSMPTLRNPLIIMAEMRREEGREGSGCCCLGHFARHLWAHFVTVLGPDDYRERERESLIRDVKIILTVMCGWCNKCPFYAEDAWQCDASLPRIWPGEGEASKPIDHLNAVRCKS